MTDKYYTKVLYAFTTPSEENKVWSLGGKKKRIGVGRIKVGQTTKGAPIRARECVGQGSSEPDNIKILFEGDLPAQTSDINVHFLLKSFGCQRCKGTEWFECSLDEIKYAYGVLCSGRTRKNKKDESILVKFNENNYKRFQDYTTKLQQLLGVKNATEEIAYSDSDILDGLDAEVAESCNKDLVSLIISELNDLKSYVRSTSNELTICKEDLRVLKLLTALGEPFKEYRKMLECKFFKYLERHNVESSTLKNMKFSLIEGTCYSVNRAVVIQEHPEYRIDYPWKHIKVSGEGVKDIII